MLDTQRWIVKAAGRGVWLVVALCVLQGLMAANGVAFALLMRQTIDQAVAGNQDGFWFAAGVFGFLLVLQVVLRAANRAVDERTRSSFDNRLRQRAFRAVLGTDYRTASAYHSGELVSRMTSDVTVVSDGAASLVPNVVSMGIRLVGALGVMWALVPELALVFLLAGGLMVLASTVLRGWLKRLHRRVQERESAVRCFLQECLESLLVVHAFGCEDKAAQANARNQEEHRRARLRKSDASNACNSGLSLAMQLGYLLGFVWCGYGILTGTITYGTMMAIIQLVGQIQSPFASLGGSFSKYSATLASAERLMELEEGCAMGKSREGSAIGEGVVPAPVPESPSVPATSAFQAKAETAAGAASAASAFEAFGLEGVTFGYQEGRPVLCGCSLEVRAGEFVGVVGASGDGKSTVMKLLLGAYEPDQGKAYVCEADGVRRAAFAVPAGLFAYVPQGNRLMSGTVREAVGFAEREAQVDQARLELACWAACADEFVQALPQGYDTVLGEHGAGLSEGQMQRLAVARAVYSGAPVLLLDEATSALDAQTELLMLERLRGLPGRTALVVTHRTEALAVCDRVVQMEGGNCVGA